MHAGPFRPHQISRPLTINGAKSNEDRGLDALTRRPLQCHSTSSRKERQCAQLKRTCGPPHRLAINGLRSIRLPPPPRIGYTFLPNRRIPELVADTLAIENGPAATRAILVDRSCLLAIPEYLAVTRHKNLQSISVAVVLSY